MDHGMFNRTKEGSPQGGSLSPLLANIYLNEFDQEMASREVPIIRYADDIVVLAHSERVALRLLGSSKKFGAEAEVSGESGQEQGGKLLHCNKQATSDTCNTTFSILSASMRNTSFLS